MDQWRAVRSRVPRLSPLAADGLLALIATGVSLAQLQAAPGQRHQSALNIALVLLQTLPLVVRRRVPFMVFAVGAAALAVQGILELQSPTFAFLAVNVAVYSLAAYGDRRLAVCGVGAWAVLLTLRLVRLVVRTWPRVAIADLFDVVDDYVLLAAAWTLGEGIRQRRLHAAELQDRPPAWSGNARRGPGKRPPRNAFGSPASCTTWWPTA